MTLKEGNFSLFLLAETAEELTKGYIALSKLQNDLDNFIIEELELDYSYIHQFDQSFHTLYAKVEHAPAAFLQGLMNAITADEYLVVAYSGYDAGDFTIEVWYDKESEVDKTADMLMNVAEEWGAELEGDVVEVFFDRGSPENTTEDNGGYTSATYDCLESSLVGCVYQYIVSYKAAK